MKQEEINTKVIEIQRLKNAHREPFRSINIKKLKDELLSILPFGSTIIESYVLYKTDTFKPYLQIYTLRGWRISQEYFHKKTTKKL